MALYAIAAYPSRTEFHELVDALNELSAVSFIETAAPGPSGFSEHTNATIARALRASHADASWLQALDHTRKPALWVLYQRAVDDRGYRQLISDLATRAAGVILEWEEADIPAYAGPPRENGVEFVQCIAPWMPPKELVDVLSFVAPHGIVYMICAPKTGAALFDLDRVKACAESAKAIRPDIKILAGFGIANASDATSMARIEAIDGIVVGTAFLEALERGLHAALGLVRSIAQALAR